MTSKVIRLFVVAAFTVAGTATVVLPTATAAQAACTQAGPTIGVLGNASTSRIWAQGTVRNCNGNYDRACVRLVYGTIMPPRLIGRDAAYGCANITPGFAALVKTANASCAPGYYWAQVRTWNNRSSGGFYTSGSNGIVTSKLYTTICGA